jgi:hypothetical protein
VPNPEKTRIELARLGDVVIGRLEDGHITHYNVCYVWPSGRYAGCGSIAGCGPDLDAAVKDATTFLPWADLVKLPKRDDSHIRATLERCVKVLQEVQWSATEHDKYGHPEHAKCPVCEAGDFGQGAHLVECELAACIRDGNELLEGLR